MLVVRRDCTKKTAAPTKPKGRQNGYSVFVAEFRREHKDDRDYRNFTFKEWNKTISDEWKSLTENEQTRYKKKAKQLNLKNCKEPVGQSCPPKAAACEIIAGTLSLDARATPNSSTRYAAQSSFISSTKRNCNSVISQ